MAEVDKAINRKIVEELMFGSGAVRRFTQDSPVLPDVWVEYMEAIVEADDRRVSLLLTPFGEITAGAVAKELRARIAAKDTHVNGQRGRVVYNQSAVSAELDFEDMLRLVLPMTSWWQKYADKTLEEKVKQAEWLELVKDPENRAKVGKAARGIPPDMLWMIRVAGALLLVHEGKRLHPSIYEKGVAGAADAAWEEILKAALGLARDVRDADRDAKIYSVSLNRAASATVSRSTLAVKADAARRLFDISCDQLAWAVIDSGIDATHPAFRKRVADKKTGKVAPAKKAFDREKDGRPLNNTRVKATYDFNGLRDLLDPATRDEVPERLARRLKGPNGKDLRKKLDMLYAGVDAGHMLDWRLLASLIEVPHDVDYEAPLHDHGTHVAGILAGDWRLTDSKDPVIEGDLTGVCPDLPLYDLRVLDRNGRGDEFSIMAALQFARHLNMTNDYMAIHGVNLSLSIPHDVANYACGRTPICDECERVVASGVVVVAAAGNLGYRKTTSAEGMQTDSYSDISITDPGNADQVITVGATHRYRPHTYGVSYFSSRGPTGDGRLKPDLVAPGEKISAPVLYDGYGYKDGTSMAAPHVSGAAALLMARHNELVAQPRRIKEILCSTATDLGRERYFQGAGMLDILRALQSV